VSRLNLESIAQRLVRTGNLEVVLPGGRRVVAGDGTGPKVAIALKSYGAIVGILSRPSMGVGEAYMSGALVLEAGSIRDLIEMASRSTGHRYGGKRDGALKRWWKRTSGEANARIASLRNVAHHYDLSLELYSRFLDEDLQYSCAYFERPQMTLEAAQAAKKRHIAGKLLLEPGKRVLDIGCGWGGMGLTLAGDYGAQVHGVTLSTEQLSTANRRAKERGLEEAAKFTLTDYRDVAGPFDRIVSVGMFEHVGRPHFQEYFDQVARLLTDDGVALVHSIGRSEGPATTDPWTAKYMFPGGYIPALSEVLPAVERAGLRVTDIEILRLHYAETLKCWWDRFQAHRGEIAQVYDERFCRMWEYYLAGAEMGFRYGHHMVFQMQLTKTLGAAPITRNYMAD
jgi:cyclopropane-fatty-acyl-phospholipid synthase